MTVEIRDKSREVVAAGSATSCPYGSSGSKGVPKVVQIACGREFTGLLVQGLHYPHISGDRNLMGEKSLEDVLFETVTPIDTKPTRLHTVIDP